MLAVVSCKKSKVEDKEELKTTCATIKYKSIYGNSEAQIIFDEKGRIIEQKNVDGTTHLRYKYSQDKIEVTSGSIERPSLVARYTLDSQGKVIQEGSFKKYEYNAEGYLIGAKDGYDEYLAGRASGYSYSTYTWQNGNLVKIVSTSTYTGAVSTTTMTYGDDIIKDKLVTYNIYGGIYPYPDGYLPEYFGKISKNAPLSGKGGIYSYIKDAKGDIIGYKDTYPFTTERIVDYNCK